MTINSVEEYTERVTEPDHERPQIRERSADEYEDPVYWGPSASLDAGDAASRLGIDMGEPGIKAASFRYLLETRSSESLVKEAAIMGGLMTLGRGALSGAGKLLGAGAKGAGKLVGAGAKGAHRFGKKSRNYFVGRRAAAAANPPTTAGGKVMQAGGNAFDAADVGFFGATATAPAVGYAANQHRTLGGFS